MINIVILSLDNDTLFDSDQSQKFFNGKAAYSCRFFFFF